MPPRRHMTKIPKELQPLRLDSSITFKSIGGLEEHIRCLREMVLFPLMYPDFFKRFNSRPPKGVLFHGAPGTGKTLLARALANECSKVRGKRVSFFMRKGADVMSKWYGESEKLIKNLFNQANKMRPSIIFFDEMDALAPTRSEGAGTEVYNSVVATLLVEMDGLWNRGDVIVIGATNRPDCLDPALRRPGRFDRELYFPPPGVLARREILNIHTQQWNPRPSNDMLDYFAQVTNGYLGSDLYALCSEAVIKALRRVYPQVYKGDHRGLHSIDTRTVEVIMEDMLAAKKSFSPASSRCLPMTAKRLPKQTEPLLQAQVDAAAVLLKQNFPQANSCQGDVCSPSVFMLSGDCAETYLAPALLTQLEHCSLHELSMATLHSATDTAERAILSIFSECRRSERSCVIFVPNILAVWESLGATGQALFLQQWKTNAGGDNVLLLATCNVVYEDLPDELQELFPVYKNCVYQVRDPTPTEVNNYLGPIVAELPMITKAFEKPGSSNIVQSSKIKCTRETTLTPSSAITTRFIERGSRKRRHADYYQTECKLPKYAIENSTLKIEDKYEEKDENEFIHALGTVLKSNVETLSHLGLETLTDLHSQLVKAVQACTTKSDYLRLPQDLHSITSRYLKIVKKS